MSRFVWEPIARADLRSIEQTQALGILHAMDRFAKTGAGDVRKLTDDKQGRYRLRVGNWRWAKFTMEQFADVLTGYAAKPVLDRTELKGKYDLTLRYVPESMAAAPHEGGAIPPAAADAVIGPNLFQALQTQLGLKLEPKKGMIDVLVIDHAERVPTEN